ncbi:archemetzincin, partial [Candidatus Bathyarchaeota archaeon]
ASRRQYLSTIILNCVKDYAERNRNKSTFNRILGVTDVDLYAPGLNFIFGEAELLGEAAIISLCRLRPEFYGKQPNRDLFTERAIKEAIHEIGHTLGLRHCPNPTCVMHFSLHIGMTDRKRREFCHGCRWKIERYLNPFRAPDFL